MTGKLTVSVLNPGMYSTIQDHGRPGFQAFGVPFSGVMSKTAADEANWLVGNTPGTPVVEVTLKGPTLKLQGEGSFAISGAPIDVTLNQNPVQTYESIRTSGTSILQMGAIYEGCRSYLAISGSWKIASWLDSFSAAPVESAKLTPQSILKAGLKFEIESVLPHRARQLTPSSAQALPLKIVAGPEYHQIPRASIVDFLNKSFTVSSQSNRMGVRLQEPLDQYKYPAEVISSGIIPGTIQVTNSGQPIILTVDAQTIGGYPRIANILSADQERIAQLRPGDKVRFELVSITQIINRKNP